MKSDAISLLLLFGHQGDSVSNKSDSVASHGSVHSSSEISANCVPGPPPFVADNSDIVSFSLRRAVSEHSLFCHRKLLFVSNFIRFHLSCQAFPYLVVIRAFHLYMFVSDSKSRLFLLVNELYFFVMHL